MRLECSFVLKAKTALKFKFPIEFEFLDSTTVTITDSESDAPEYPVLAVCLVRVEDIELVEEVVEDSFHGQHSSNTGLKVKERDCIHNATTFVQRFLGFIAQRPLGLTLGFSKYRLVTESTDDEAVLDRLGSSELFEKVHLANLGVTSSPVIDVSDEDFALLLNREIAFALYSDALRLESSVAAFREFWRILESAFGLTESELVKTLSTFAPMDEIDVSEEELQELRVLRGRASHAQSRNKLDEYRVVTNLVGSRLSRLRSIVEKVILTKKHWGVRDGEVHRLGRQTAYMGRGNVPTFVNFVE